MSFTNPYPASRLTLDPANSLANGLVGFWPLTDGSGSFAKDISTGANDGTLGTGVTWSAGNLGTNAEFPSTAAGRIDTGLDMAGASAVTVSAWVRNDGGSIGDSYGKIVTQSHGPNFDTTMNKNGTALTFFINSTTVVANNADIPSIGTWFHVCFVWEQSVTQAIYINGSLSNSGTADTSVIGATTHNVFIGGTSAATRPWDGGIQNVRIYNRALSATEVATLYNRPWESTNFGTLWPYSPPAPADATLSTDTAATILNVDLEGWWLTTDNTGTTLVDISGNGRDATLNGTNSWVADSVGTVNRFDNSSSNGNNARTANTQPDLTSGYTATFWVKHEEAAATGNKYGAGLALTDGSGTGSWWNTISSDLELYFNTSSSTSSQWPQIVQNRNNGGTISAYAFNDSTRASQNDVWKFWAITFDGTNARIYRDASLIGTSGTLAAPLSTTGKHIVINGVADTATGLTCSMQNIRLYSRALTADEISLLYERPFEGITYGDAFHYDPPTPANLTPLTSDSINNSQIGWWPLTETDDYTSGAADISGNTNNGTQSGGVLSEVSRLGGVASFDGSNDYIDCTAISQGTAGSFTVSAWCNPDTASKDQRFFTKWNVGAGGTAPDLFNIWYDIGGANVGYAFAVKDASLSQTIVGADTASGGVGVWSHVVGVYDSTGPTMTLYVDGVQIASGAATGPIAWNTNNSQSPVRIGAILSERADGLVQNCRLWTRALSADEVWSIYANPWLGSAYQASAAAVLYNYILRSKRFRRLS